MLHEKYAAEIEAILAKYDDQRSAVMPLLYIAQDEYGYLTNEAIREVATILEMPYTDVFEVVTFYTLYYDRPVGRWVLQVCDDVPCCYLGAEELLAVLKQKLGVVEDQVTPDGMFMVQRVKCLAACDRAPLLQANLDYVYDVMPERVDTLLHELRARAERGEPLSVSGRSAEDYEFDEHNQLYKIERRLGALPQQPAQPVEQKQPAASASELQEQVLEPEGEKAEETTGQVVD